MLAELNVRDIALIDRISVSFGRGLNILTGETGTGKSVIIGSCMLALGAKARGDVIRRGAKDGYVELVFEPETPEERERLRGLGIELSDEDPLVISRKISPGHSISRINGETVTVSRLREISRELIDIYGQNEHQSLLSEKEHLRILDDFLIEEIGDIKHETELRYEEYRAALKAAESFDMDESERLREAELCEYEINEIREADIRDGEEEELKKKYKKLSNMRNVMECLGRAAALLGERGCGEALEELRSAARYDEDIRPIFDELSDADSIVGNVVHEIEELMDETELDERSLARTEERLELVRRMEQKYGQDAEAIREYLHRRESRLSMLKDYDENRKKAGQEAERAEKRLLEACRELSERRRAGARRLCSEVESEMKDLNFSSVSFGMDFGEKAPSSDGYDTAVFVVSLNPGEEMKPLMEVASGGELSRTMLAIKTVLAKTDDIPTLIFDEIDTGISGRTAQKVSEKLGIISGSHQVICITHLPQIAAMADCHFAIRKSERDGRNVTTIDELSEEESVHELSRLLSGAELTESVYENAREMKSLAGKIRKERLSEAGNGKDGNTNA